MKFASFKINGTTSWGLIDGNEAVDLGAVLRDRFPDLKSAIATGALAEAANAAAKAARHPLASLTWLPVVPNPDKINSFMNIRVADIQACYELWKSRGAEFITEPIPKYGEIRCYIRDPDGYIIEVGQSTDLTYG